MDRFSRAANGFDVVGDPFVNTDGGAAVNGVSAMNVVDAKERLEKRLYELKAEGRVAIAFSGGVDSTLLVAEAHRVLGDGVLVVSAASPLIPHEDLAWARTFCEARALEHLVFDFDPFSVDGFVQNPRDRCYRCKKAIMGGLVERARDHGASVFADGTNADDVSGAIPRPGLRALRELGFVSPLAEAGLTKKEVRALARDLGLEVWNKPAAACLATRFPYGALLTSEDLNRVEKAEALLHSAGFTQLRVRVHGTLARIELLPKEYELLLEDNRAQAIHTALCDLGFSFVTLDLAGFHSGGFDRISRAAST